MNQEIIVYIIAFVLATFAIIRIVRFLTGKHDPCGQCGECDDKKKDNHSTCSPKKD